MMIVFINGVTDLNTLIKVLETVDLAGVADGISGDCCLVSSGALAVAFDSAAFNVFLRVVERAAGVTHEDGSCDSNDCCADKHAAHELQTEYKAADDRNEERENGRSKHLADSLLCRSRDHFVVIRLHGAFEHAGDGKKLVAVIRHDTRGFDGVVGEDCAEVFDQRAADDTAGNDQEVGKVERAFARTGDEGNDKRNGRKCSGADGKALADSGGGVADGIELIGDNTNFGFEVAGFGKAARVVRDRAECVDGNGCADECEHTECGDRNTVNAGESTGNDKRYADNKDRSKAGTGADGITLGDNKGFAFGSHVGELFGRVEIGTGVVFGDGADGNTGDYAENCGYPRGKPAADPIGFVNDVFLA